MKSIKILCFFLISFLSIHFCYAKEVNIAINYDNTRSPQISFIPNPAVVGNGDYITFHLSGNGSAKYILVRFKDPSPFGTSTHGGAIPLDISTGLASWPHDLDQSKYEIEVKDASFNRIAYIDPYIIPPSAVIPTLKEWGLIIFSTLLLGIGSFYLIRRRRLSLR
jgi:hypothetical protein